MVKLHLLGAIVLMAIGMFSCQKQQIISDAGGGGSDKGSISLVADPDKIFIGESVDLIATVLDEDGDPVSGETVHFEVDSDNNGQDGTDSNGKAYSSWTAPADSEGPHTAKASVNGDYDPDTATRTFTVYDPILTLTADADIAFVNEEVELEASISEILGGTVEYRFYDGQSTTPFHVRGQRGASYSIKVPLDTAGNGIGNNPGMHRFRAEATITRPGRPAKSITGPGDGAMDEEAPESNEADVMWAMVNLTADLNENNTPDNSDDQDEDEYGEDTDGGLVFISATAPAGMAPDLNASMRLWVDWEPKVEADEIALDIADNDVLQLWSKSAGGIWTKETTPLVWPGDGNPPGELWIEGLESGTTMVTLTYKQDGQNTDIKDQVKITVGDIKVKWEAIDSPLSNNPNAGGGKRIFPGKLDLDDNVVDRSIVFATATVYPPAERFIYFVTIDVDDPSSNQLPLDDEELQNDNHSTFARPGANVPGQITSTVTDANGVAKYMCHVPWCPGDNIRVVVSFDNNYLVGVHAVQNNTEGSVADANEHPVPNNQVTEMLTVWRTLHIEQDSMAAPDQQQVAHQSTAGIKSVAHNVPSPGLSTIVLNENLPTPFDDENMFEGGAMTIRIGNPPFPEYTIVSNTSHALTDDEIVVVGLPPLNYVGALYNLRDDDDPSVLPAYLTAGDIGDREFARAYIKLKYMSEYSDTIGFWLHLTYNDVTYGSHWNNKKDLDSEYDFWCHLVVACFQADENQDADPDGMLNVPGFPIFMQEADSATFGYTRGFVWWQPMHWFDPGSCIFVETIRDSAGGMAGNQPVVAFTHKVVTHEIVHAKGRNGLHDDGGIMSAGLSGDAFTDITLHRLRYSHKW